MLESGKDTHESEECACRQPCMLTEIAWWPWFACLAQTVSVWAFPGGSVVKNLPANSSSVPWVGKIPWRRKWQPTPVFLPEESHGQRSLTAYSPRGHKSWTQLSTHAARQHLLTPSHPRHRSRPWGCRHEQDVLPARQASLPMEFSRQEYWSGVPFLIPGDFLNLGIETVSLASPALAAGFFTTSAMWEAPM